MKMLRLWKRLYLSILYPGVKLREMQTPDTSTIVLLDRYHVKASYRDEFFQVLSEYVFNCRRSVGNIMTEAYYELGDSCIMWIVERWESAAFYKKNKRSIASKIVNFLAKPGLVSPVETIFLKDLELLLKDDSQKIINNDQPLSILLFVDVKQGSEEYFRSINRDVMIAFRNRPGVQVFRLSQLFNDSTRFVVYKKFFNRDAFQSHLKAAALVPVIEFLQTSVKDPPFEKGYRHLIEFAPLIRG